MQWVRFNFLDEKNEESAQANGIYMPNIFGRSRNRAKWWCSDSSNKE